MGRKSNLKIWIPVTSIDREVLRRCRALNFDKYSYQEAIEELSRRQEISRSIHLAIERCRDCNISQLKNSIDNLAVKRCRAICPALVNNFSSLVSWSNFHGFNTRLEQHVSWSIKHILDLPKYKKSAFCQRISQLHKRITYVLNKWNTYVLTICFISCFLTIFYGIVSSSPDMISCNKFWTNELDLVNGAYVLTDIS